MMKLSSQLRILAQIEMGKKDMTQVELAKQLGVSRQAVYMIMNGQRDGRINTWEAIFKTLGVDIDITTIEGECDA